MTKIDRPAPRRSISFHILPEQWEAVAKAHRAEGVSSHSMMARNIFEHGLRMVGLWDPPA